MSAKARRTSPWYTVTMGRSTATADGSTTATATACSTRTVYEAVGGWPEYRMWGREDDDFYDGSRPPYRSCGRKFRVSSTSGTRRTSSGKTGTRIVTRPRSRRSFRHTRHWVAA